MLNLKILFIVSVVSYIFFISIQRSDKDKGSNIQKPKLKQDETWAEVQIQRKLLIQDVCQQSGTNFSSKRIPLDQFSFLPQYNLLYCRISKAGSSTWLEGTLMRLAEKAGYIFKQEKKRPELVRHLRIHNMDEWEKIMKRDPLSFVNVRHPYERLVSAYLDSVVDWKHKITHRYKGHSFESFLTNVVLKEAQTSRTKGYERMFVDWRPYSTRCNFCNVPFKVVSKTETFDEDRGKILEMLEVEDEKKEDKIHVHTGDQTRVVTKKFFANISATVKQELLKLYQYDFALFGYDTNSY